MNVAAGEDAPPFTLPDQDGKPWSLSEHRGTPVVLLLPPGMIDAGRGRLPQIGVAVRMPSCSAAAIMRSS